jgi:GntR family transcriptional regulator
MAVPIKSNALAREPLYLQVGELLTRQIATGAWKPNETLPNELELARELGVSTGTVRKALEKLEADRLVVRRQGRGTFVLDQTAPEAASRFERLRQRDGEPVVCRAELLRQSGGAPTPAEQRALHIGPDQPVVRTCRLLRTHAGPFAVEEACLALSRLPGLEADAVGDRNVTVLAQRCGVHLTRARERVHLVAASAEVASLLGVDAGVMLMRLDRTISSSDEAPIEWRIASCRVRDEYYAAEVSCVPGGRRRLGRPRRKPGETQHVQAPHVPVGSTSYELSRNAPPPYPGRPDRRGL